MDNEIKNEMDYEIPSEMDNEIENRNGHTKLN